MTVSILRLWAVNAIFFINAIPGWTQTGKGLDEKINEAFMPAALWWEGLIFTSLAGVPIVLILLLVGALWFTLYFRFANIRYFTTALRIVKGNFDHLERKKPQEDIPDTIRDESHYGEVNHFQALATAISGTVGLGNISMVAVAISIGGPGAAFWMIVAGLLGMSSKLVECTLGVKYREISETGKVFGGPMYYLSKGLKERHMPRLGKVLSIVFALLCIGASLGGGNAFQSNQAAAQLISRFSLQTPSIGFLIGVVLACLVGFIIIGGIKRIARVTEKIVPFMAILYVGAALFILITNAGQLGDIFQQIINEAFTPKAGIAGGFFGVMIQGFRRAAFSNEAGAGSAAIAHSAVATKYPASEGMVALLEPFIDTVIICTLTALVIIHFNTSGVFAYGDVINNEVLLNATGERIGGVNITSMAFDATLPGFSYLLVIAVLLFAFSTMISWSYYGLQAWSYLFGRGRITGLIYKILFLVFTVLGSSVTLDAVIKFSDSMILALVFPNMIGLLILFPNVKKEITKYLHLIHSENGRM